MEALKYLYDAQVDIINLSLATHDDKYAEELQFICDRLSESGTVIISSLANHCSRSYPAIFKSVIGVQGELYIKEREYIYHPNHIIQCHGSGVPVLVEGLDGVYTFFGGNSKAVANMTGILAALMTKNDSVNLEGLLISHSMQQESSIMSLNDLIYKEVHIDDELLGEKNFLRLIDLVQNCLKIPSEKQREILKKSLLNPYLNINKMYFGPLFNEIEKEWKINLKSQETITLFQLESIKTLYELIKRTLNNES